MKFYCWKNKLKSNKLNSARKIKTGGNDAYQQTMFDSLFFCATVFIWVIFQTQIKSVKG